MVTFRYLLMKLYVYKILVLNNIISRVQVYDQNSVMTVTDDWFIAPCSVVS